LGSEKEQGFKTPSLKKIIIVSIILIGVTNLITGIAALYVHRWIANNDRVALVENINSLPVMKISPCEATEYKGAETTLYSDRGYHTVENISEINGYSFCKTGRHSRVFWVIRVTQKTEFYMFATKELNFVANGWKHASSKVFVDAVGLDIDGLYKKEFEPGLYMIQSRPTPNVYPFWSRTTFPVLWKNQDIEIIAAE
jgi:hypothetical protein